jgi:hypothetical protein
MDSLDEGVGFEQLEIAAMHRPDHSAVIADPCHDIARGLWKQ